MSKKLQSIKGFYDVLPDKTPLWHFVEDKLRLVMSDFMCFAYTLKRILHS